MLSEMEKSDEISKVKQRFFYYKMRCTVWELGKTDEKLKKLREKTVLVRAKVPWIEKDRLTIENDDETRWKEEPESMEPLVQLWQEIPWDR